MKIIILGFILVCFTSIIHAQPSLTFAVVPQQSSSTLAKLWSPMIEQLSLKTGLRITFTTAPDIPTFEKRLAQGKYDIAYMNPYHYIIANKLPGYRAIAKARDKEIKGILVIAKNSPINKISDLKGKSLAFPAPNAFAATILNQAELKKNNINFLTQYVSSHDSVYRAVAKGIFSAGGGVLRTFNNIDPNISDQLRILSTTKGYTPHAIAVHPRISKQVAKQIQQALIELEQDEQGLAILKNIKIKGFEKANNKNWNDIRRLNL